MKSGSITSISHPKIKVKKKKDIQGSGSAADALESEEDMESPPSEEVSTLVLEPAEVLVIGTNSIAERLASHLTSKLHRGNSNYFPS